MNPGILVVGLAVLAPWATKLPLATSEPGQAYTQSPTILLLATLLGVLAVWVAQRDRWLGALLGWQVSHLLWQPNPVVYETVETMSLGAFMLLAVRDLDATWKERLRAGLLVTAVLQVAWLTVQWIGYDWTWAGFGRFHETPLPAGTFGNKNYLAAFLAMVTPLAPVVLLPVFAIGLILTHSFLAIVAACAGLLLRWPDHRRWLWLACGIAIPLAWMGHIAPWATWHARWEVWMAALSILTVKGWLLGVGPGQWLIAYQYFAVSHQTAVEGYFAAAHNDLLQLLFESGLPALGLLGGWAWAHRGLWRTAWGGSALAVLLLSLGFFPWHLVTTGMVALVVLGCATAEENLT